jgi:hypothetical protein
MTAHAESLIGLYKTECVRRDSPFRDVNDLELATCSWVAWFNQTRLPARSATSHPSSTKPTTTVSTTPSSSRRRDNQPATEPGTVHTALLVATDLRLQRPRDQRADWAE